MLDINFRMWPVFTRMSAVPVPTIFWVLMGICISIYSWKNNEKAYENYVKLKNKS